MPRPNSYDVLNKLRIKAADNLVVAADDIERAFVPLLDALDELAFASQSKNLSEAVLVAREAVARTVRAHRDNAREIRG